MGHSLSMSHYYFGFAANIRMHKQKMQFMLQYKCPIAIANQLNFVHERKQTTEKNVLMSELREHE